ncbi:Indolepyruvate oxidoreductase subunit IorA [Enhygromyxa salina]|uniref:Indolepyruvate oxidoreductase subunit IorA n=1 Tax=Enhygromyxa salina TaxID=215803 RepID=A0A0C2CV56_9BACT|nr:thiamine pyrophosphate-dependent enzyme [Enhygromyxa salina]KIG14996.1 Indolepyruvate oxidoreductase subunit IorA [Enhygromyxa salina]
MSQAPHAFLAALRAGGVSFVTAFPGSPTTTLALLLEREGEAAGIEFRWTVNENAALSQAFGAAMAGRGAAAIMKHVGINVAADALNVMGVVHGLAAPLLLFEGADAKPGSSQSAQDNRPLYAGSPNLLVVSPTSPGEIIELVADACSISRAAGMLVVVRGDHRCFAGDGEFEAPETLAGSQAFVPWPARGRALACSARTYAAHLETRADVLDRLRPWIESQVREWGEPGELAVVVAAHLGIEAAEAARARGLPGLRLRLEHPLPERALIELASRVRELVVLEECTTTLETSVRARLHAHGLSTRVLGRRELGDARTIGRLSGESLAAVLDAAATRCAQGSAAMLERAPAVTRKLDEQLAELPAELLAREQAFEQAHPLSGFPPSDPRGPLFDHLRALGRGRPVFVATDPGVTGLLALAGQRSDVKMHMGGAVPIAAGWSRGCPHGLAIAVVGDTNLPHSEWLPIIDAVDHGDDLLIVIADNGSSEMTQHIVTPRVSPERALASFAAIGARCWTAQASASLTDPWATVLAQAAAEPGVRLVWLDLR